MIFDAEKWLSVDTDLKLRLSSNVSNGEPVQFQSRFYQQTRKQLSESNLWVSIMYRPGPSTFTRVERASCALVYVYLSMISSAMFYRPEPDYDQPKLLELGPIKYSLPQVLHRHYTPPLFP